MSQTNSRPTAVEWACRVILTVHFYLVLAGYISFAQTKYQLTSPVIPCSTIEALTVPFYKISLVASGLFLVSLWLYFARLRIAVLVLSSISFIGYLIFTRYFLALID